MSAGDVVNVAIRQVVGEHWKLNGDLMTCRHCGYSVIASRMNGRPSHGADCPVRFGPNPWRYLHTALTEIDLEGVL